MKFSARKVVLFRTGYKTLLFGLFIALLFHSCDMSVEKEKVEKILNDTFFTEQAENVEMHYSDSGTLKAIIYAPTLERHPVEEPFTIFDKGITSYFYGPGGNVENSIKSNYGISYDSKKIVELRNDVRVVNIQQEKLNTDKLIWDQNTGKIYTDAFVKITTPENIIFGEGFEANQDFSEYRIFKVKGTISVNEENK